MKFGIDKCVALFRHHGKIEKLDGIKFKNGNIIKSLSSDDKYKYFGILEADNIVHTKVKELTEREYIKRLWKILKSKLNGGHTIKAINIRVVPVIRYPAGIIDWTQNKLEELDQKAWKLMNMHHVLHPKLMWTVIFATKKSEAIDYCKFSR